MSNTIVFNSVAPIGSTDVHTLPIKDLGPAIGYYTQILGFTVTAREADRVTLQRNEAIIGLEKNDSDPEQASVYFGVNDVEALRAELAAKGIEPSELRTDQYGGKRYRVFFAKEPYGVCFCFGQQEA